MDQQSFSGSSAPNTDSSLRPRPSAALNTEIRVYRDLSTLEPVWKHVEKHGHLSVFQTWSVFHAWATNVAPAEFVTWFVIVVVDRDSHQPLMLLPLSIRRHRGLTYIEGADLGVSDYYAPVTAKTFAPTQGQMLLIWNDIQDVLPAGDVVQLSKLPAWINGARNPLLHLDNINPMKLTSVGVDLDADWSDWAAQHIDPKLAADMLARTRKLSKRGRVTFEVTQDFDRGRSIFEQTCIQRAERHTAMQRGNILAKPGYKAFYEALFKRRNEAAPGIIAALSLDDEVIATGYGLSHGTAFHMIFPTFKANRCRNYSPGTQLFLRTMEWAATHGYTYFDFTIGSEQFKFSLGAREKPLYEKLVALSPRGYRIVIGDRLRRLKRRHFDWRHEAADPVMISGAKS